MMFRLCDLQPDMISTQLAVDDIDKLCSAYLYLCEKHPEIMTYNYRASRKVLPLNMTQNVELEACV